MGIERDENGRFLPGSIPNPGGRPAITEEERFMRDNFKKSFAMLGTKTIVEIEELAKDRNQPAPIAIAAKALSWAFKSGNPSMYREIWDRTVGKVKEQIEVTSDLDGLSKEKLIALALEEIKKLKNESET